MTENCANFDRRSAQALLEVGTLGYPSQASIEFLRSNSVASYMRDVGADAHRPGPGRHPVQPAGVGRHLHRAEGQGTPVSLVWQSWGHSNSTPVPVSWTSGTPRSPPGPAALAWFDHYVRGTGTAAAQDFGYYRDWVFAGDGDIDPAYATAPSYPVGTRAEFYLSGEAPGASAPW